MQSESHYHKSRSNGLSMVIQRILMDSLFNVRMWMLVFSIWLAEGGLLYKTERWNSIIGDPACPATMPGFQNSTSMSVDGWRTMVGNCRWMLVVIQCRSISLHLVLNPVTLFWNQL